MMNDEADKARPLEAGSYANAPGDTLSPGGYTVRVIGLNSTRTFAAIEYSNGVCAFINVSLLTPKPGTDLH